MKTKGSFILLLVITGFSLASCITYKGQVKQDELKNSAQLGNGFLFGTYYRNYSELLRYPVARLIVKDSAGYMFDLYVKMTEKNQKGAFLFDLPPGNYQFTRIMCESNQPGQYYIKKLAIPFAVEPRKISYLGSLALRVDGFPFVVHAEITNSVDEDKEVLKKQYKAIETVSYRTQAP